MSPCCKNISRSTASSPSWVTNYLLEDLTSYTFVTPRGLKTAQEVIAMRDPKIKNFNVEELLDQRILTKVVKSGYVEEIERKYKLRP